MDSSFANSRTAPSSLSVSESDRLRPPKPAESGRSGRVGGAVNVDSSPVAASCSGNGMSAMILLADGDADVPPCACEMPIDELLEPWLFLAAPMSGKECMEISSSGLIKNLTSGFDANATVGEDACSRPSGEVAPPIGMLRSFCSKLFRLGAFGSCPFISSKKSSYVILACVQFTALMLSCHILRVDSSFCKSLLPTRSMISSSVM
mmetsp:Transcript_2900/g.8136  ORF Transcript_2900/g.8136 Transcript_2900/m.8136 type:complete len:206 (+) Transcript_2900:1065-1682(+)